MANDTAIVYEAGADLSLKQFYAVKDNGAGAAVIVAAATDLPIGILQNKPTSGKVCEIANGLGAGGGRDQVVKARLGGTVAKGALLGVAADGRLVAKVIGTDITHYVCARAGSAGVADDIIPVIVIPVPFRAA